MKVVGIVCSSRIGGNTEILVREALAGARSKGADAELVLVAGKTINPCDGCDVCIKNGVCRINDDMKEIYEKILNSDGIIFGTPAYFMNVSGQAKIIIDRTYSLAHERKLRGKVGGVVIAADREAGVTLSNLYSFFIIHRMLVAGGTIGHGRKKGEVKEGVGLYGKAIREANAVGRNVVRLIKQIRRTS